MPLFTLYDVSTGAIIKSGNHPDPESMQTSEYAVKVGVALDDTAYRIDLESGEAVTFEPPRSDAQLQNEIVMAIQARLDTFARTRGYDSILSAATYATSAVPQFAAEGQRAAELRDATWATLYVLLAEVQTGARPVPAGIADIEADLPILDWSSTGATP